MSLPSEAQMRAAISARDPSLDGVFVYAVLTTGVFCRPSCASRHARPENLRFFPGIDAAMAAGYRPCKRCRPTETGMLDTRLVDIARYIDAHAETPLTLAELSAVSGLSAGALQRGFTRAFSISPKTYRNAVRMRRYKQQLKDTDTVTEAIFAAGFGSTSRVYGEATRNLGMTPSTYRAGGAGETIAYACRQSALGLLMMAATDKGVCCVQFGDTEHALLDALRDEFPRAELIASSAQHAPELNFWMQALKQYLDVGGPRPDLPLDMRGTVFQMQVWRCLLSVREGEVLSYRELAERLGMPSAVRAVASACGRNRIGVLIPCHRVLRSDGGLGGYRWGLERKRQLLEAERQRQHGAS
ncbi:bifunctional transcriptional activator/DNA repair enzyme AdaA [Halomonas korlensis]|uniref:methylated-DNA--[protein]-cysteine S-methyltransferase n=1 Tax=Halomonas korlensis TaxID=463301 RepID=A0A1I7IK55_9GAMM|nr:methylated-DNA--[protein]-cysteine S-methyltransferase [Halomonas korlensis]SFU73314.1 AraC family transcriptional regulator, regulatory protein of adaptative response / methylated-DNA-[protein]-cysteine methyltransferase [Halomonas korlensis]